MNFEVYNYQFSPLAVKEDFFTEEAKAYRAEALKAMDKHLAILDNMLTDNKDEYPLGIGLGPFKDSNVLHLIRKKTRKRKNVEGKVLNELTQPFLNALLLYGKDGIYVMSVQNKTLMSKERGWKKYYDINEPSCLVILANTPGRQFLLVEVNGAFGSTRTKSKPTTHSVCRIFEDSFKALFRIHKLDVNFRPHYGTNDVWKHMLGKYATGIALKSLKFEFDYPNMAADVKLLKGFFKEIGTDLNAKQEYTLKGHHGQPLNFDPNEGKRNPHIASIIEYDGNTGNKQVHTFMDNSKVSFDAKEVGISTLTADRKLEELLRQLQDEYEGNQQQQQTLFHDFDNDKIRNAIATWLNALNRGCYSNDTEKR